MAKSGLKALAVIWRWRFAPLLLFCLPGVLCWWRDRPHNLKIGARHTWIFIALSAIATGLSWLFYYRALQLGQASRVAPIDKLSVALTIALAFIFLSERPTFGNVIGGLLVVAGVLATVFIK